MTNAQYLLARGWRRSGAFPGGGDQWYDVLGRQIRDDLDLLKCSVFREHEAVEIQLNRDAELRDFVNERRPPRGETP